MVEYLSSDFCLKQIQATRKIVLSSEPQTCRHPCTYLQRLLPFFVPSGAASQEQHLQTLWETSISIHSSETTKFTSYKLLNGHNSTETAIFLC